MEISAKLPQHSVKGINYRIFGRSLIFIIVWTSVCMQRYLRLLFMISSVMFIVAGGFFLFTTLVSLFRPDILLYDTRGYLISVFVAVVCFSFAYTLYNMSRRMPS